MADTDKEQRTEEASGRKLDREKSKGNVAYSKEVSAAALLLAFVAMLRNFGGDFMAPLGGAFRSALSLEGFAGVSDGGLEALMMKIVAPALIPAAVGLLFAALVTAVAGFGQVGIGFSAERLELKWSRLNPIAGFGRIFSLGALGTLGSGVLKIGIVGWLAWDAVALIAGTFAATPIVSVVAGAEVVVEACLTLAMRVGMYLAIFAAANFLWRRFSYKKDLRMTKQEVKDEHKQDDGDPAVKGEIKRRMREIGRQKMMGDVRKADVVVRNPTHFAVALRYDRTKESAPRVLAKGADALALRIIAEAEKRKVPVVSRPEVAREIYRSVKVGAVIPPILFKAAAALLAYVARRKRRAA